MKESTKMRLSVGLMLTCFLSSSVYAGGIYPNEVITIDPVSPKFQAYPFIDDNLEREKDLPDSSDVVIINQSLMSNEAGERWATVTLKNSAKGKRIFSEKNIYAMYADGSKGKPYQVRVKLNGGEIGSSLFYFGKHKFPILYVFTREK